MTLGFGILSIVNTTVPLGAGLGTTVYCLATRRLTTLASRFMAAGHFICLIGLLIQAVMLVDASSGWELLFLPLAFGPGQIVAFIGLVLAARAT
ncbi:hypothetical protein QZG57_09145 [Corynebacterium glucuronolyticum]|uniref:hypothetical protein n=1 Tax=Corynebacterium glucuronolyticum TaxID=39791 RepID=UPI003F6E21F8